ncbi:MAG: NUDIX hydrolase [Chloroflexi bacterium]|nr:NUDIX hydrolase [Chloroflexota bacterium]
MADDHDIVRQLLAHHQPYDEIEAQHMATVREMIEQYPNILSRACKAAHITGSALVIDNKTGKILLHYHKKLNRWLQFGGHMDTGELDPADTALREAKEESGLTDLVFVDGNRQPVDIDVHPIPARGSEPEHLHLDFRYVLVTNQVVKVQVAEHESDTFAWFSIEDLLGEKRQIHIDSGLLRLVHKVQHIK